MMTFRTTERYIIHKIIIKSFNDSIKTIEWKSYDHNSISPLNITFLKFQIKLLLFQISNVNFQ